MKELTNLFISTKTELYLVKEKLRSFMDSLEFGATQISQILTIILEIGWAELSDDNELIIGIAIEKRAEKYGLIINFHSSETQIYIDKITDYFDETAIINPPNEKKEYLQVYKILPNPDFYPTSGFIKLSSFLLGHLSNNEMIHELKMKNDELNRKIIQVNIEKDIIEAELDSRSMFLAYLSHEIRTPMNGILGFTEILLKETLSKKQRNYLRKIKSSGNDLLSIVTDILDFSKIKAGKLSVEYVPFNLTVILNELLELFSEQAESKGIKYTIEQKTDGFNYLIGDPLRLKQVLINLTSNAIKFTNKGSVLISVELQEHQEHHVELLFKVSDTGIGIRKSVIAKLFSPFTQADDEITRKFGGTGLGLFICKQLAELMGGEIQVESVPEKGAKFSFNLTFKIDKNYRKESGSTNFNGLKVLVVDAYLIGNQIIAEMMEGLGFICETASFGEQAIDILNNAVKEGRAFDLIIIDYNMPFGLNGGQTAKKIKDDPVLKNTKLIITSTYDHEHDIHLYAKSIDACLKKPVSELTLSDAIKKLFGNPNEIDISELSSAGACSIDYRDILQGCKVMLADDNLINQKVVSELLTSIGVQLVIAGNGRKAIDKVNDEYWDAVLMDVNIPEMDMIMAFIEIKRKEKNAQLPVIAMIANIEDKGKYLKEGINDYISKPFVPKDLYVVLSKWIFPTKNDGSLLNENLIKDINKYEKDINLKRLTLTGINVENGLRRVNGQTSVYIGLLKRFRHKYLVLKEDFEDAFVAGKIEEAKRYIHTIKGASGTIGATKLYKAADEFEKAFDINDIDFNNKKVLFFNELTKILNALSLLDETIKRMVNIKREKEEIIPETIISQLNHLKNYLDMDIGEAITTSDKLLEILENTQYEDDFTALADDVYSFNIESAKIKLKNILEKYSL